MKSKKEKPMGIFICHWGKNIAGDLDIEVLVERAKQIKEVAHVMDNKFNNEENRRC